MQTVPLWPFLLYFGAVLALVGLMIGLSAVLGQRHMQRATGQPFESGIATLGTARIRVDVKFYLIAMFFVIFDLEAVFLFAWAVAIRDVGWAGYAEALTFVGVLAASLVYLWRQGALDWGTSLRGPRFPSRRE